MTSCSAIKLGGGVVFPKQFLHGDWLGTSLLEGDGEGWLFYHFSFFFFFPYPSLIKLYLDPQGFFTFASLILSALLLGKSKQAAGDGLFAGWGQPTSISRSGSVIIICF